MPAPSAVVIGINYSTWPTGLSADVISRAGRNPLQRAEADAQAVAAALRGQGYTVTTLVGVEATRTAILDALEAAETANADGQRLFYFAGHGELDPYNSQAAYLLPADADPYSLYLTAIPLDDLARRYLGTRGSVLAVFDTCPAGPDPLLAGSQTAGMGAQFGERAAATFAPVPDRAVLAACADDPAMREPPAGEHGALTAALLDYWTQHRDADRAALVAAVAAGMERAGQPRPAVGGLAAQPAEVPATPPTAGATPRSTLTSGSQPAELTPPSLAAALPLTYLPAAPPPLPAGTAPLDSAPLELPGASPTEMSALPPVPPSDPASEVAALLGVAAAPDAAPPAMPAPPPPPAVLPLPPPAPPPAASPPPTWTPTGSTGGMAAPPRPAPTPARPDDFTWPGQYTYTPTPPPPPPRRRPVALIVVGAVLAFAVLSALCSWAVQSSDNADATATAVTASDEATETVEAQAETTATAVVQATQARQAAATSTALAPLAVQTFGPQDGKLVHAANNLIKTDDAAVTLRNFVASARFTNPYGTDKGSWDYGFLFRSTGDNQQYRIVVLSTGEWRLQLVAQEAPPPTATAAGGAGLLPTATAVSLSESAITLVAKDDAPMLNTGAVATNDLRLVVNGTTGWLFINGQAVGPLDLSAKTDAGDIEIGSGFFADDEIPGMATYYTDFTVWALP